MIKLIEKNTYTIQVKDFLKRITSVVQFIDALDMSPAYQQGTIVGMHIGALSENSLGHALGLQQGDIVLEVNNIPATSNADRLAIYRSIIGLGDENNSIKVSIFRGNDIIPFSYILNFESQADIKKPKEKEPIHIMQDKANLLRQKYQFSPTTREIRMKERENMKKKKQQPTTPLVEE